MLFFSACSASDQNSKWHMLFGNPTSGHPSFIHSPCSPSFLTPCDKPKKKLYYFHRKRKSLGWAYFWSNWAQKWIATKPNDLSHLGLEMWTKLHTLFVSFMNPTSIVGALSPPLSPLYTWWVVLTQSFFYIL
jgi:hypothetical protein